MTPTLGEYISTLKKLNPGITDLEIKDYLINLGYKPEDINAILFPVPETLPTGPIAKLPEIINRNPEALSIPTPIYSPVEAPSKQSETPRTLPSSYASATVTPSNPEPLNSPKPIISSSDYKYPGMGGYRVEQSEQVNIPPVIINPEIKSPKRVSSGRALFVFLTLIILLILGGTFAYFTYFGEGDIWKKFKIDSYFSFLAKAPYTEENFLAGVVMKLKEIESAEQKVTLEFSVTERDAGRTPYKPETMSEEEMLPYKRDEDRFRDLFTIYERIEDYFYKNNKYPKTLKELGVKETDSKGVSYVYVSSTDVAKKEYTIKATFETDEALDIAKNYNALIDAKGATFKQNSNFYNFSTTRVIPKSLLGFERMKEFENVLSYVPSDTSANISFSGVYNLKGNLKDTKSSITGSVESGDFTMAIDAELIKAGVNYYAIINKAPSFFGDLSKIKKKWIKINEEDLENQELGFISSYYNSYQEVKDPAKAENYRKQSVRIIEAANEFKVVTLKGEPTKIEGEEVMFEYRLQFNLEGFVKFYESIGKELKETYGEEALITFNENVYKEITDEEFRKQWEYFTSNLDLVLWADKSGIPRKVSLAMHYIPVGDNKKINDKQLNLSIITEQNNINKPIELTPPQDFLTYKEVVMEFTGVSEEEYELNKIISSVNKVRSALSAFKTITGSYPDALSELTKPVNSLKKQVVRADPDTVFLYNSADYYIKLYGDKPLLSKLPGDIFKDELFNYVKNGLDYSLGYNVQLPKDIGKLSSIESLVLQDYGVPNRLGLLYVEGKNTSSEKEVSLEAKSRLLIDSDRDQVSDDLEMFIGIDKNNPDSDKDGVKDREELTKGNNPNGPGKLQNYYKSYGF